MRIGRKLDSMQQAKWSRVRRASDRTVPVRPEAPPLRLIALPSSRVLEVTHVEAVLGRHSEADLQVAQSDISRFHCRLAYENGRWHIEDLGSLNGTLVNGERIQRLALKHGDVIRIGGNLFEVDLSRCRKADDTQVGEERRSQNILKSIAARLPA